MPETPLTNVKHLLTPGVLPFPNMECDGLWHGYTVQFSCGPVLLEATTQVGVRGFKRVVVVIRDGEFYMHEDRTIDGPRLSEAIRGPNEG